MIKKNWKVVFLPFLFRECPSGNAHLKNDKFCFCCEGKDKNWTFKWTNKGWQPVEHALQTTNNANSLSFSGQLTTLDLIWNGLKTGLTIAFVFGVFIFFVLRFVISSAEKYEKTVQYNYEKNQTDSE